MGLLFVLPIILLTAFYNLQKIDRQRVFNACVVHKDFSKTHLHTSLSINQNGKQIIVPKNLGIRTDCMHPLHTHDNTGLIHIEYPKPITFYLGDFFDLMGVVFSDNQIGALKTMDGYKITVKRNGKIIEKNYRSVPLKDLDKLEIVVFLGHN